MFRIAEESFTRATCDLMAIAPTDNCLDKIMLLAKTAEVTLYPGHSGSPFYLELPNPLYGNGYEQICAMFDLAQELELTAWEYNEDYKELD